MRLILALTIKRFEPAKQTKTVIELSKANPPQGIENESNENKSEHCHSQVESYLGNVLAS
jgi:hypothetical protein